MTSAKILLLEDNQLFAQSVDDLLSDSGYTITCCFNSNDALNYTYHNDYDLYLLDINVPQLSGTELLYELRNAGDSTPAIFITSYKQQDMLQKGFASGCDDYIKKPFDNEELLLRIEALLKRTMKNDMLCIESLCCDTKHKQIYMDLKELSLKPKEYLLLALLMKNYKKIVTNEMIIDALWNHHEDFSQGAVRVYINRIKQLIGAEKIQNIRGIGYKLVLSS